MLKSCRSTLTSASLIKGEITGKQGDTFTAGKLGRFTVGANNTVLLGDPYRFNKDNIDQFNSSPRGGGRSTAATPCHVTHPRQAGQLQQGPVRSRAFFSAA